MQEIVQNYTLAASLFMTASFLTVVLVGINPMPVELVTLITEHNKTSGLIKGLDTSIVVIHWAATLVFLIAAIKTLSSVVQAK